MGKMAERLRDTAKKFETFETLLMVRYCTVYCYLCVYVLLKRGILHCECLKVTFNKDINCCCAISLSTLYFSIIVI